MMNKPAKMMLLRLGVWTAALLIALAAPCLPFNQAHSIGLQHGLVRHAGFTAAELITLTLTAKPTVVLANGSSAAVVTATVTSASSGEKLEDVSVNVERWIGVHASVLPDSSQLTDDDGNAVFTVRSSTSGVVTLFGVANPDGSSFALAENLEITFVATEPRVFMPFAQRPPNPDELPLVAIKNGDFEAPGAWAFSYPDIIYPCKDLIGTPLKSGCGGFQVVWLGGVRSTSTLTIAQPITMTNWYPVQVRFRYFVESTRTDCTSDKAEVWFGQTLLGNKTLALCKQNSSAAWQTGGFELPRIAATELLRFESQLAGGEISSFFVDDVSLCTTSSYRHPAMPVCP